ncbi:MAG: heme lyase CcmF/NrfE family subunit [Armatimonadota bacterium]|nr:heme lyase CcmF/NrfE family subunit [Armatimonadota bacterium]MDR7451450.1 heme lyase CcmF/NrfE family subunit [Armatimonadota bacterium]MDR7466400.1 heme lyase CcmF/NrfE family subunit [Armatimonadota bacterium]MDR7493122.1 heme lyase CcmF/NrfE family subunit [Armatimonadota bacterium]MDR7498121.1 heme lyase CcmF/NrfE family subunit [Armatimonadota bacterium]
MDEVGTLAVGMAFVVSLYGLAAPLMGQRGRRPELLRSAVNAVYANALLLVVAAASLLRALLRRDFGNAYVASYTSRDLGFWYTVSAFWAGQAGSLLFWALMLAGFAALVVWRRGQHRALMPYVVATLMGTSAFFTGLLTFVSSPFARLPFAPPDGAGLNPLLQNPGMFFHPPTQYLGYVGFTVPFAFAIGALATGRLDDEWIRATRRWTLLSWFFLSWGIIFGMMWAYVELGWGGYWAWDPVENASLMPWLTATAFLHSVMIQEKRDMLKVWNLVLIILTFVLSIFGTFLTRSGVLSSVHSFALSSLGPLFFVFILLVLGASIILLVARLPLLHSRAELDSLLSRESSFLFNNLILVGAAFSVFLGTVFPILSEAVRGVKISVGPPFFNQVNVPIGLAVLFLMGVCPLLAWRKASPRSLRRNFLVPGMLGLLAALLLRVLGMTHPLALVAFALCVFVTAAILQDFHRGAMVRRSHGEPYLLAAVRLVARNHRRYGGYVVHLGMILLFAGIAGGAFSTEREVVLRRGETATVHQYLLRYEGASTYPTRSALVTAATLTVFNSGKPVAVLTPQRNIHKTHEDQPMTEVAIRSTWREDLYVILAGLGEDGTANFRVIINPLMMWMWAGAAVLTVGTLIAFWPERGEALRNRARYLVEAA